MTPECLKQVAYEKVTVAAQTEQRTSAIDGQHCRGLPPSDWNPIDGARKHNSLMGNEAGMCKKTDDLKKCDEAEPWIGPGG